MARLRRSFLALVLLLQLLPAASEVHLSDATRILAS